MNFSLTHLLEFVMCARVLFSLIEGALLLSGALAAAPAPEPVVGSTELAGVPGTLVADLAILSAVACLRCQIGTN